MSKFLSYTQISEALDQQQELVGVINKYLDPILSDFNGLYDQKSCADFVMHHLFVNIRNSCQDGIFISQGLINVKPYYVSTSLSHAQRSAQEFLIDLAYIMSDRKHRRGNEYLRYLKFIFDAEDNQTNKNQIDKDQYDSIFPTNINLDPKSPSQWSHTHPQDKIDKGLKLYKIESSHFADFRFGFHSYLSSIAHGNDNTIYTLTRKHEENLPQLEANLSISFAHFEIILESALKCYMELYLNRHKDYNEIIEYMKDNR